MRHFCTYAEGISGGGSPPVLGLGGKPGTEGAGLLGAVGAGRAGRFGLAICVGTDGGALRLCIDGDGPLYVLELYLQQVNDYIVRSYRDLIVVTNTVTRRTNKA